MPIETEFEVNGLKLAAKIWGPSDGKPVIALHGWLDNLDSFAVLAPLLQEMRIVALDLPGHGKSSHHSADASYNIWDDVSEIVGVIKQLGWEQFSLIGHSRGAIISMLIAGSFPDWVRSAVMLDGFWPLPVEDKDAPQQLARAILDELKPRREAKVLESIEPFVQLRVNGFFKTSVEASRLITERNVVKTAQGYRWSTDPRLKNASSFKLSMAHINAFLEAITAPVKVIIGEQGIPILSREYMEALYSRKQLNIEMLPGSHHLHLEKQSVQKVADSINLFINSHPQD